MAKKGQILTNAERLKISQRTREGMQRPEVKQRLEESWTPERRKVVSEFHKEDSHRPERIAISMANLPAPMPKEANPSWRGGHYKECAFCGKDFWVNPYREGTAKYCSRECKDSAQKGNLIGANNPNWREGNHSKICLVCGKEFQIVPSQDKTARYCSRSCHSKVIAEAINSNAELRKRISLKVSRATKGRKKSSSWLQRIRQACQTKPTGLELKLIELIAKHRLPFKYVGDGGLIIGGYCPDFININGKKQLIEAFGDYWHSEKANIPWHQTELGRIMAYNSLGFECLVIWEHELEDEKAVMDKIVQFTA